MEIWERQNPRNDLQTGTVEEKSATKHLGSPAVCLERGGDVENRCRLGSPLKDGFFALSNNYMFMS